MMMNLKKVFVAVIATGAALMISSITNNNDNDNKSINFVQCVNAPVAKTDEMEEVGILLQKSQDRISSTIEAVGLNNAKQQINIDSVLYNITTAAEALANAENSVVLEQAKIDEKERKLKIEQKNNKNLKGGDQDTTMTQEEIDNLKVTQKFMELKIHVQNVDLSAAMMKMATLYPKQMAYALADMIKGDKINLDEVPPQFKEVIEILDLNGDKQITADEIIKTAETIENPPAVAA